MHLCYCVSPQMKEAKRLKEFLEDYDDDRDDPKYYRFISSFTSVSDTFSLALVFVSLTSRCHPQGQRFAEATS